MKCARVLALVVLCLAVVGCTNVPFDTPKVASYAADRPVGRLVGTDVESELASRSEHSALIPLADGNDALGARIGMIEAAKHSIDMQYFLLKPDLVGAILTAALLDAADRGVRVRFLLDDVFTTASDRELAVLDAHPNVELRLMNPLSRKSPKFWNFLFDFNRVNRRMHNKSMTVDRALGIVGGRNVADEYYRVDTTVEFADFDMLVAGPVIQEIADQFDIYWNDPQAVPLAAFVSIERRTLSELSAELEQREAEALAGLYKRAVDSTYIADLRAGKIQPSYARTSVSHDLPDKLQVPVPQGDRILAQDLLNTMAGAKEDVILVTPYFVPEDWGAQFFSDLARRGVRVRIITNSLASTNHAYVHAGYKRHRKLLVDAGVELHEIRADAIAVTTGPETAPNITMHAKIAVVDGQKIFVGSMNFDPRSIKINSEFGIFIDDPLSGEAFRQSLIEDLPQMTFAVRPTSAGGLAWIYDNGSRQDVFPDDPGASAWRKFVAGLTGLLPVEGQL